MRCHSTVDNHIDSSKAVGTTFDNNGVYKKMFPLLGSSLVFSLPVFSWFLSLFIGFLGFLAWYWRHQIYSFRLGMVRRTCAFSEYSTIVSQLNLKNDFRYIIDFLHIIRYPKNLGIYLVVSSGCIRHAVACPK